MVRDAMSRDGPGEGSPLPALDDRRAVRLLFVEDDEDYRLQLRAIVGRIRTTKDFEAVFLGNVEDARRVVEATRVDAVVSDFDLPDGTGADVLKAAIREAPRSTRIVLTGAPERAALATSDGNAHGIWSKDLTIKELMVRLTSVILGGGDGRVAA